MCRRTCEPRDSRNCAFLTAWTKKDVDAILSYLKEHEVPIVFGPFELYGATGFGTSIYVLDPDMHTIELKANYSRILRGPPPKRRWQG